MSDKGALAPERPHLSFSRLQTFESCPRKYRLRYIEKVPERPSGPLIAGRVGHQIIEVSEREGWWQEAHERPLNDAAEPMTAAFRARFTEAVEEAGGQAAVDWRGRKTREFPDGENFLWWANQAPAMLRRYATIRRDLEEQGYRSLPDGAEMKVGTTLGEHYVVAYLDLALYVTEDGETFPVDWKFGTWSDPFQLAVQAWLVKEGRGLTVTRGAFGKLRKKQRPGWFEEHDLTHMLPLVPVLFTELAASLDREEVWPLKRSNFCVACTVRAHCPWGATLDGGSDD